MLALGAGCTRPVVRDLDGGMIARHAENHRRRIGLDNECGQH